RWRRASSSPRTLTSRSGTGRARNRSATRRIGSISSRGIRKLAFQSEAASWRAMPGGPAGAWTNRSSFRQAGLAQAIGQSRELFRPAEWNDNGKIGKAELRIEVPHPRDRLFGNVEVSEEGVRGGQEAHGRHIVR